MYHTREETVVSQWRKNEEGEDMKKDMCPIVCLRPRLVLETIHGVATTIEFVAVVV